MAKASSNPLPTSDPVAALPMVRLEVRPANGRPTVYEVGDGGFLIGSVPGCDLRLPGANLPPVVCLLARNVQGASLRKLAPVHPIVVNGRQINATYLRDGDLLLLGMVEITVSISPGVESSAASPLSSAAPAPGSTAPAVAEQIRLLKQERSTWEKQRRDSEAELQKQKKLLEDAAANLRTIQQQMSEQQAELEAREQELQHQQLAPRRHVDDSELQQQLTEIAGARKELAQIRQQLYQRYHEKRDRLNKQHQAIRRAANKLRDRKLRLDQLTASVETRAQEWDQKYAEVEAGLQRVQQERELLEEQARSIASRQQETQREMAERANELLRHEEMLTTDRANLEKSQKQHQGDLLRLDRIQAGLEQRQKQLQQQATEVDQRYEQLQRDSRDLEEQAAKLDDAQTRLLADTQALEQSKKQVAADLGQIDQRAMALESQQAMLASLRTRLERMREELRQQEETLSDQRALHEAAEEDLRERNEETEKLRWELNNDRQLFQQERTRFQERQATLDQAIAQMRQAQELVSTQQEELTRKRAEVDALAAEQAEQTSLLLQRGNQVEALHGRLNTEREGLKDRETALGRAELTVATLQEQLRRRAEELSEKQKTLAEQDQRVQELSARTESQIRLSQKEQQLASERLETMRQELAARATALEVREQQLQERELGLRTERDRLEKAEQLLTASKRALASERVALEVEKQASDDNIARAESVLETARGEARQMLQLFPELEAHTEGTLERMNRVREQLREHLGEIHTYARQSREDLEMGRKQLQFEVEKLRQQEVGLHQARDEHRLAVAAFRQQLIEWHGQVGEMKQVLLQDESRLDRKQALVEQKAQEIESTNVRLSQQAEELQRREEEVTEKRGAMDRHLVDMREWYRRKLRELSGIDLPDQEGAEAVKDGTTLPLPPRPLEVGLVANGEETPPGERDILSLTGDLDPGDRQLGDNLRTLELIDADTLSALLLEAHRQRRSLRQLLLAGGYLTLYQMALIEAGDLDKLVLGPVRVIDRLQATSAEAIYRVFDPRRDSEAVLRVLAESEMEDAMRPDEFRQRFSAAVSLQHPHLLATLEVLEIGGRPAVLQEWLVGVPSSEWPALAAAPGVWYRLFSQAALALQTIHAAGLPHGNLQPASFVFTAEGSLKLLGFGEPGWLQPPEGAAPLEPSVSADLRALGRIAAGWADLGPRRSSKTKALPDPLPALLAKLQSENPDEGFTSATELLEALDVAGSTLPANATAWERFLREVRAQAGQRGIRASA